MANRVSTDSTVMKVAHCNLFLFTAALLLADPGRAECPAIVSRQQWAAKRPVTVQYVTRPVPYVIVAHTATEACSTEAKCAQIVASIQQHHMDLAYDDIGYGFLIGGNGSIFEGRGWHKRGAHTYGYNYRSVGIAFIGNYDETPASAAQMQALQALLDCGLAEGELNEDSRLIGQRQVQNTLSPGYALFKQLQDNPMWVENP